MNLYVTPYYDDPEQHDKDLLWVKNTAKGAYDMAGSDPDISNALIRSFALNCGPPANNEAQFAIVYIGQLVLEAYLKLRGFGYLEDYTTALFLPWANTVFRRCANKEAAHSNNRGSWAALGFTLLNLAQNKPVSDMWGVLDKRILDSWNSQGVMTREISRTNSFLWYSYFSLAPLFRACQAANYPPMFKFKTPLYWLWSHCTVPPEELVEKWPYKLPDNWFGRLWKWWFPCADEPELPRPNDWPGNLFAAAGEEFGVDRWKNYAQLPINDGVNIFREYCYENVS